MPNRTSAKEIRELQDAIIEYYENNQDEHILFMLKPTNIANHQNHNREMICRWFRKGREFLDMPMKEKIKQTKFMFYCGEFVKKWDALCEKQRAKLQGVVVKDAYKDPKAAMELLRIDERGTINPVNKSEVNINKSETKHLMITAKIEGMTPEQIDRELKKLNEAEQKMQRIPYKAEKVEFEEIHEQSGRTEKITATA